MPLLADGEERSDAHSGPPGEVDSSAADADALLKLTGGWGYAQRSVAFGAILVEANFVTLVFTAVLLLPRLRTLWDLSDADMALASTSFFAGTLLGQFAIGALADRFGRRRALLVALPCGYCSTLFMFACDRVVCVAAARGLGGFFIGGALIASYVTFFEITMSHHRFYAKIVMVLGGWTATALGVVALAHALRDAAWQWTVLAALSPSPLALAFLTFDSPQFLIARGRRRAALEALMRLAALNRCPIGQKEALDALPPCPAAPGGLVRPVGTTREACGGLGGLRLALVSAAWLGSVCVYYGMVLWPLGVRGLYLTTAAGLLLEVPVYVLLPLTPRVLGSATRVWAFVLVWAAASYTCCAVLGVGGLGGTIALLQARLSTTAAATVPYIAAAEAFEASFRSTAVGFAASIGRAGSVVAPLLVSLVSSDSARAAVLAAVSVAAALCALLISCCQSSCGGGRVAGVGATTLSPRAPVHPDDDIATPAHRL